MEQLSIKSKECSRQKKPDHPWRLYEWPDFVMLQTFLLLFYICLKPRLFAHPITKPPANTLDFKSFDSILQKNSVTLDKNGKSAPTRLAPPVPSQSFQTLLKHQCW